MMRRLPIALISFAVLSGCVHDDYAALSLVPVTGTVTLDDKPLAGALVNFFGDDGSAATGKTDAAGQYVLMYDSAHPGSTPGAKTVRITLANANEEGADPDVDAKREPIPAQYNRQSELKAKVSRGQGKFDFMLKSKP